MIDSGSQIGSSGVLAAMSGGVDSSVMAAMLADAGYRVHGATMLLRSEGRAGQEAACGSARDVEDARLVCDKLGIPHETVDYRSLFDEAVVEPFCQAYLEGRTPNPCIACNRYLKFAALQDRRRALGLYYVATGHYARRRFNPDTGTWSLLRAESRSKDQSYVLYHLTQDHLAHMLFPLGDYSKDEVRQMARSRGFATAEKAESQDICFVADGDYAAFIEDRGHGAEGAFQPGPIVDASGKRLGTHRGLIHYTAGQRKGIGVAASAPLYVMAKSPKTSELIVGPRDQALTNQVVLGDINLIEASQLDGPLAVTAKTHYRMEPVAAVAEQTAEDQIVVKFNEPQRPVAPGQACVLYDGERVLGGGTVWEGR